MQTLHDGTAGIDILKHLKQELAKNGHSKGGQERLVAKDLVAQFLEILLLNPDCLDLVETCALFCCMLCTPRESGEETHYL